MGSLRGVFTILDISLVVEGEGTKELERRGRYGSSRGVKCGMDKLGWIWIELGAVVEPTHRCGSDAAEGKL